MKTDRVQMDYCEGSPKELGGLSLSKKQSEGNFENNQKMVFTSSFTAFKRYNSEPMGADNARKPSKDISETIPSFIKNFANQFPNIRHPNIKREMLNQLEEAEGARSHENIAHSYANEQFSAALNTGPKHSNSLDDLTQNIHQLLAGKYGGELAELCLNVPNKTETDQSKGNDSYDPSYLQHKLQHLTEIERKLTNFASGYKSVASAQKLQNQPDKFKKSASNKKVAFLPHNSSKKTVPHKSDNVESIVSSVTSLDEEIEKSLRIRNTPSGNLNYQFENLTLNAVDSEPTQEKEKLGALRSLPSLNAINLLGIILNNSNHNSNHMNFELQNARSVSIKEEEDEDGSEERNDRGTSKSVPGIYSRAERMLKILRYKKKIVKWRLNHPLTRNFSGRSQVAGSKPRIKGKFVTKEEYQKYLEDHKGEIGKGMEEEEMEQQTRKQNI